MYGRYHRYMRRGAPVAVVPDPDRRLPHLPGDDGAGHHQEGVRRPATTDFKFELTDSYRKWTYCVQYRETDFNFVSRLMEHEGIYYYVRHTDGHNTLVLTDRRPARTRPPGLREASRSSRRGELATADIEHMSSWEFSREVQPGVLRARRLRPRAPERRAARRRRCCRAATRRATTRSTTTPVTTCRRAGRRAVRRQSASTSSARCSSRRHGITNARGLTIGLRCSSWRTARATTRTASIWCVGQRTTLEFSDYEGMPEPSGAELPLQLRGDVHASSSSGRGGRRRSRSCRVRRRRWSSGRPATRSTPTSTAA